MEGLESLHDSIAYYSHVWVLAIHVRFRKWPWWALPVQKVEMSWCTEPQGKRHVWWEGNEVCWKTSVRNVWYQLGRWRLFYLLITTNFEECISWTLDGWKATGCPLFFFLGINIDSWWLTIIWGTVLGYIGIWKVQTKTWNCAWEFHAFSVPFTLPRSKSCTCRLSRSGSKENGLLRFVTLAVVPRAKWRVCPWVAWKGCVWKTYMFV